MSKNRYRFFSATELTILNIVLTDEEAIQAATTISLSLERELQTNRLGLATEASLQLATLF